MNPPDRKTRGWLLPAGLFLFLFGFYMIMDDGLPVMADAAHMLATTRRWIEGGWRDPSAITKYGPFASLVMLPFEQLYLWTTRRFGEILSEDQFISCHSNLETTGTALMLFAAARSLGYARRRASAVALIFALITYAAPFSRSVQSEPLQMFLTMAVFLGMIISDRQGGWKGAFLSSFGLFLLGPTKIFALVLLVLPTAGAFWFSERVESESGLGFWRRWRPGAVRRGTILACGAFFGVAAQLGVNRFARGGCFHFGYVKGNDARGFTVPVWEGLFGLTLGAGKGYWYYSPILASCFFLWQRHLRMHRASGVFILFAVLSYFFGYSRWWAWHGDWHWGPRLLLPVTPLLSLFLLGMPEWWTGSRFGKIRKPVVAGLLLLSIYVQLLGICVPVTAYYSALFMESHIEKIGSEKDNPLTDDIWSAHFIPSLSPLVYHHAVFMRQLGISSINAPPWNFQAVPQWNVPLPKPPLEIWWLDSPGFPAHHLSSRQMNKWPLVGMIPLALFGAILLIHGWRMEKSKNGSPSDTTPNQG